MRKFFFVAAIFFLGASLWAQVNGKMVRNNGQTTLTIWGSHSERGFAHGYLLGKEIKTVFDQYCVQHICMGSKALYDSLLAFYQRTFVVEARYQEEAMALVEGLRAAGVNLVNPVLQRSIDGADLLAINAIVDISQSISPGVKLNLGRMGCSSLSSWGNNTRADSRLAGSLIITRLLDWQAHTALIDNPLMIVSLPSEPDEQRWLSLAYPGFLGALSGINESGVTAFMNMGNVHKHSGDSLCYPVLFSVRSGLERRDYNEDGGNNPDDVVQAIQDHNRIGGSIIHSTQSVGEQSQARIIECNQGGVFVRTEKHDTDVPAEHLMATNHFIGLCPPIRCNRYHAIVDSLRRRVEVSVERCWALMGGAAGVSGNIQAMQYLSAANLLYWATATRTGPAYRQPAQAYSLSQLFNTATGIKVGAKTAKSDPQLSAQSYPNPFNQSARIHIRLAQPDLVTLRIYNVKGQMLATLLEGVQPAGTVTATWDASAESAGEYFYRIQLIKAGIEETGKLVLVK